MLRVLQMVERVMDDIIPGEGEPAETFHQRELDRALLVERAINQFGANDAMSNVEVELEIVRFAEMRKGLAQSSGNQVRWNIWPERKHVISKQTFLQRIDHQARRDSLNNIPAFGIPHRLLFKSRHQRIIP